jgi:hypothetical protein
MRAVKTWLLGLLRPEDLILFAWAIVGLPLLGLVLGAFAGPGPGGATIADAGPFGLSSPLRGLVFVLGFASACAALATRTVVTGPPPPDTLVAVPARAVAVDDSLLAGHAGIIGPLFGGMLFLALRGFDNLGLADQWQLLVPLGIGAAIVLQATGRAPALHPGPRRLLVLPFILAGTVLFGELVGGMHLGPGLVGDLVAPVLGGAPSGSSQDTASFGLFIFGLITAGAAVFYAMLVLAPRVLVEREGSSVAWVVRFLVWYGGTLAGLGWVAAMGR